MTWLTGTLVPRFHQARLCYLECEMLFCSVLHTAAHPTGSVSEAERHVCLMSLLTRSDCVYFFPFHCLCAIVNIFTLIVL